MLKDRPEQDDHDQEHDRDDGGGHCIRPLGRSSSIIVFAVATSAPDIALFDKPK
jgi:hypothetical protein